MDKEECRRQLLQKRNEMPAEEGRKHSLAICEKLKELDSFHHVMVYLATGRECDPDPYIDFLRERGVAVYVPVCTGKGTMEASLLLDPQRDLEISTFGIRAPKKEAQCFTPPEQLDAVIVPGVGFDRKGNRLGFGGGFYDRFLPRTRPDCRKIAICYEMQLLENAYPEEHDFPMDQIITEKNVLFFNQRK